MRYLEDGFRYLGIAAICAVGGAFVLALVWMAGSAIAFSNQQGLNQQIECMHSGGTPMWPSGNNGGMQCHK